MSCKDTILCIVEPLLLVDAGGGWCMNIAEFSSTILTWDWLKITMGHAEGLDWSGVTCACDR